MPPISSPRMQQCCSPGAARFNEFGVQTSEDPSALTPVAGTQDCEGALKNFYPKLGNAALWCRPELTTRSIIVRRSDW